MGLAPAPDVVEPRRAISSRRRPARGGTSPDDDLGGRLGGRVLEPAVAVGQAEVGGREPRLASPSASRTSADSRTAATSASCAPALAHTAPPTVPGIASPNSRPVRPAFWVSVAARAIGTPDSAMYAVAVDRASPRRGSGRRGRGSPASAMTTSLPRPRSRCGSPRERAKRTIARSSKTLWTVAKRSAGPPTRIVVNRASGSSREVLTPIRRWMSGPDRDRVEAACRRPRRHAAAARERSASIVARRPGSGSPLARPRRTSPRPPRPRRAGRARGPRRPSRACASRSSSRSAAVEQRVGVEVLVRDEPAAPASTSDARVRRWWPAACGYGTTTDRQPERGHLGQRRRAGPTHDQVGGGERGEHLVAQERVRPVAVARRSAGSVSRAARAAA